MAYKRKRMERRPSLLGKKNASISCSTHSDGSTAVTAEPVANGGTAHKKTIETKHKTGGLNTAFVLDTIMCPKQGLRPLDLDSFSQNDEVQPLRIVSSAVDLETGKLKTVCFGSKEGHFRDDFGSPVSLRKHFETPAKDGMGDDGTATTASTGAVSSSSAQRYPEIQSASTDEKGRRRGLWACLQASMTVPGAAGSPILIDLPSSDGSKNSESTPHFCYDAFCYEPIPYRSAVAEGATHVLALRSRPASYTPKTKPNLYNRAVAPLYFRSKGVQTVAEFFEKGGQQYLSAEDVLTLDEGLVSSEPIPIPPPGVLYGAPADHEDDELSFQDTLLSSAKNRDRESWDRAHLLPITVPADVPELSTLSQDRNDILAGIRSGFASAYDVLAPVVGIEVIPGTSDGKVVAEQVFPEEHDPPQSILERKVERPGEKLRHVWKANRCFDMVSSNFTLPKSRSRTQLSKWFASRMSFKSDADLSSRSMVGEL